MVHETNLSAAPQQRRTAADHPPPLVYPPRIRFDRHEFAGAFGDIGTDIPLLIGMILASGADCASVLITFGLFQLLSAVLYGIPMPVQPLKAVAAIVIARQVASPLVHGAGLAIGLTMLLLTLTGSLKTLARLIPKPVIRGIQLGLGLQLGLLALQKFVPADGGIGYLLAIAALAIMVALHGHRRWPPALIVLGLGVIYAFCDKLDLSVFIRSFGVALPRPQMPTIADATAGFLLLGLAQIPLSLGNSILATSQASHDFFPWRPVPVNRIGLTYSLMNLLAPFLGGMPVCHGSGGMAGHYALGGRTGGSVCMYGLFYLALGLFFSRGFHEIIQVFPKPILGVILLFEALALLRLIKDQASRAQDLATALLVGLLAVGLPYGYLLGMILGTLIIRWPRKGQV